MRTTTSTTNKRPFRFTAHRRENGAGEKLLCAVLFLQIYLVPRRRLRQTAARPRPETAGAANHSAETPGSPVFGPRPGSAVGAGVAVGAVVAVGAGVAVGAAVAVGAGVVVGAGVAVPVAGISTACMA